MADAIDWVCWGGRIRVVAVYILGSSSEIISTRKPAETLAQPDRLLVFGHRHQQFERIDIRPDIRPPESGSFKIRRGHPQGLEPNLHVRAAHGKTLIIIIHRILIE